MHSSVWARHIAAQSNPTRRLRLWKAAKEIQPENVDATLELGSALLDTGSYAEAETLLLPLAGEADIKKEVSMLLLASYGGQGKIDECIELMKDQELRLASETSLTEPLYFGRYNAEGKREGFGIGIYSEYWYIGEYKNNVRSGHGIWISSYGQEFEGEWADDAPNGYGEYRYGGDDDITIINGNFVNGLENGEMTKIQRGRTYHYSIKNGIPVLITVKGKNFFEWEGEKIYYVTEMVDNEGLAWQEGSDLLGGYILGVEH